MNDGDLRVLSLFSGIGGLDLGVRRVLPGARWVAYVEREAYACAILAARMDDGSLAPAPVLAGNVTDLPASALAGSVDLVVAGFPCPPVSVAGRRRGSDDGRWLWPEVARVLRETGAEWCLVENVPGILSTHAGREFGGILADLAEMGYDAEWGSVSAADAGAPHRRERVFLLARSRVADAARAAGANVPATREGRPAGTDARGTRGTVADAVGEPLRGRDNAGGLGGTSRPAQASVRERERGRQTDHCGRAGGDGLMGDPDRPGLEGRGPGAFGADELPPWPPGPTERDRWARVLADRPELAPATVEPVVRGMADGLPRRVDRLRALGNAVVPAQAELALRVLLGRFAEG